jgi:hypothetical protein
MNLDFCRGNSALRSDPPDPDDGEIGGRWNCDLEASAALSLSLFALAVAAAAASDAADAVVVVVPSLSMSSSWESDGPGDEDDDGGDGEDCPFFDPPLGKRAFRSAPVVVADEGRWK